MRRENPPTAPLILASQSASRRAMLAAAGVAFSAISADVDEASVKLSLTGRDPTKIACILAERKAIAVSACEPEALVIGSDSLVALADGTILDKPRDRDEAADHLRAMSGGEHRIISAAVLARGTEPIWRHVDGAILVFRTLSDNFIEAYLDREWPAIAGCVGCFRIEGPGVQLFDRIVGDHFTVLGMPLLAVLAELRARGMMQS